MTFDEIDKLIKKHFYIIFQEMFSQSHEEVYLRRYVAKHPLLRPEFIVQNDQPLGFKRLSKKVASLEEFPIYIEIEGVKLENDLTYVDTIELYSEANLSCQPRLNDVIYLSHQFADDVILDRSLRLGDASKESLIVYSKIPKLFFEASERLMEMSEAAENLDLIQLSDTTPDALSQAIDQNFKQFVTFIQLLDDIIVKNLPLKQ